jgi:vancomycin resistance protein YoaR
LEGLGPVRDRVDVPPHSATLRLDGRRVEVEPAVEGRTVDDIALERAILASLAAGRQFDAAVPLAAVAPAVTDAEAQAMAGAARVYLSRPIVLRLRSHTVTLTPTQMAPLLAVNTGPTAAELPLTFNNPRAIAFLHRAFRFAEYPARDATIAIRGKQAVIVPSRQGQAIDVQGLTSDMDQAASSAGGLRTLTVQLTALYPRVTTDALQQLGLSGLGSEFTTYYDPSNAARAANIALCAKLVDGTVIPAGHVFSLNDTVGPRTLNRGFDYAPVIVNGVLMQGVGGGLCQFATTLFNAAFFAGLPIVERHPHQFAIEHYPLGRDASVAWGAQDLRFRNTTGHALMIRAWASKSSLTIVIVGATGRTVTYDTGPMRNVRQPSCGQRNPRVVYDDTISAGISRLEPGAPGYTISVTRTVSSNGRLLFRDTFTSTYQPKDWIKRIGTRTR